MFRLLEGRVIAWLLIGLVLLALWILYRLLGLIVDHIAAWYAARDRDDAEPAQEAGKPSIGERA